MQRAAVDTEFLAELPDGVTLEQAATLPVAGLTALLSLELGGFVLGSGCWSPAPAAASAGSRSSWPSSAARTSPAVARRTDGLRELGADEVLAELDLDGPDFDVVLDAIGGGVLGAACSGSRRSAP